MKMKAAREFDPITLEILWNQLIAAADEQAVTIHRTAFSSVVRESSDFSCVLLDAQGDLLAQPSQSLPAFTRCASVVVKHFLARWPDWHPDDVAITNDPWLATGHFNDVAIAAPIILKGKLVGFSANIAHQADFGGRGYSADAGSIFEEGLALPPMKLYRAGIANQEIFDIVAENVRVPHEVLGDLQVQVTAARRGAARVCELLADAGIDDLEGLSRQISARSEAAMARAIRQMPEGVYDNEGIMDGYNKPLVIKVKLTVKDGAIEYDFAGTSPQVEKGINSCYNFSYGYAAYAAKAALEPLIPNNEGCYRPIRMIAPEASLVNSRRPAPGNSRGRVGQMIVPVVFGALAKALPGVIPADAGSPAPRVNFSGKRADGREFQCLVITCGGLGAQEGLDGVPCKAFPSNTTIPSIEVTESTMPLRFLRRELRVDSGGPGKHRGGLGQHIEIKITSPYEAFVSTSAERIDHPPIGYSGGGSGLPAELSRNGSEPLPSKARTKVPAGEVITIDTPGGGGYGPADQRAVELVLSDVELGYVTADEADKHYPRQFAAVRESLAARRNAAGYMRDAAPGGAAAAHEQPAAAADRPANSSALPLQLGIDIGGTFTDFVLIDTGSGRVARAKTLTTPKDPVVGIMNGIDYLSNAMGIDLGRIGRVVHGTTLVANTIIERKGVCTGLITTDGFRDILEIGNDTRYDIYDLQISFPPPLVPRFLRAELKERTGGNGTILETPDFERLKGIVEGMLEWGVTALAICFLHSYRNPANEQRVRDYLVREFPGLDVSISSEVAPVIREYDRTSTVVANSYVLPIIRAYLNRLEAALQNKGLRARLFVMLSDGGVTSAPTAAKVPVRLVESGPAGGVLSACYSAQRLRQANIIAFDMGGTTAKVCFVNDGRLPYTVSMEVARTKRQFKGSGIPTMVPSIEMVEIGAGGGSIARIGKTGVLKVGPDSAGSLPGPACYSMGGQEPTVTDADLVLGYIDPRSFLGGDMALDRGAAVQAIETLAVQLGVPIERAAHGILEIVNSGMATALRTHAAELGLDYRKFAIVASGGAGPVHVYELARLLSLKTIICPMGAGTGSALGFLVAPVAVESARSMYGQLEQLDWDLLNRLYDEMESEALVTMRAAGVESPAFVRMAELRFSGQGFEVSTRVPSGVLEPKHAQLIRDAFEKTYVELYGTGPRNLPVEALTWRLRASSESGVHPSAPFQAACDPPQVGTREAYFPELGRFVPTPVYSRYRLKPGTVLQGPALIEERESTLVVGPQGTITVSDSLDLVVALSNQDPA